jgi:hypothetical protein
MQPVCSHNKRITDFCSWRGLLVLGGVRDAALSDARVIGSGKVPSGDAPVWVGDVDDVWRFPKPTGRGGPWHETTAEAGAPSDPYLMAGYDKKQLEVSHDVAEPVTVTVEIDPAGDGEWFPYATLEVPSGTKIEHAFPAGYSAHWVRLVPDKACTATATFTYE